jgi:hypothetical protein
MDIRFVIMGKLPVILAVCLLPVYVWAWGVLPLAQTSPTAAGGTTFTFIDDTMYHASANTAAASKPTGTAEDDIMFALVLRADDAHTEPSTVPTNWTEIADHYQASGDAHHELYWKLAGASEPSSYTWEWSTTKYTAIAIVTYRGGFDTADPIDVVSNTEYTTNNTTCRAASMSVGATNSPMVSFFTINSGPARTFTTPTNPSGWSSDADDKWAWNAEFSYEICSMTWSGSGSTSDMDSTMDVSDDVRKHAFAVALNPE